MHQELDINGFWTHIPSVRISFLCTSVLYVKTTTTLRTGFFALSSNVDIGQHSRGIIGMIVVLKLDS